MKEEKGTEWGKEDIIYSLEKLPLGREKKGFVQAEKILHSLQNLLVEKT